MNLYQADYYQAANNMLERYENYDFPAPGILEVKDLTGQNPVVMATSSGLNDFDYQNLEHLSIGQKTVKQIQPISRMPIPAEILDHFNHIKCHCMMGLFPEIGRAWLTIDSDIYIWTYEHIRDVAYYDGLSQLITGVGLIKPKPKVFIENIHHLLVLATATEIIMLGVTFGGHRSEKRDENAISVSKVFDEMHLMPKPVFTVSTDGNPITVIKGSKKGRIFLGGKDGCLYEIDYKAESTWFGSRCKKVNHSQGLMSLVVPTFLKVFSEVDSIADIVIDDERDLLFILSEKGAIEVWDLGPDGYGIRRISRTSRQDIAFTASSVIRTIDPGAFKSVKSVSVISEEDCSDVNVMAVTECGVRLYFSTISQAYKQQQFQINQQQQAYMNLPGSIQYLPQNQPPPGPNVIPTMPEHYKHQGLFIRHVRLPPGYTPNSTLNRPRDVHFVYYTDGTTLMASSPQQDQDILWSISSSPFPNKSYLIESTTVNPIEGVVYDIAELKDYRKTKLPSVLRKSKSSRKIIVLTNEGAHLFNLLKPIDILQQLFYANQGPHHENIKQFFQTISESEACAACLLLACSEQYRGSDVALWASQAFMLYGGEPHFQAQGQKIPNRPQNLNTSLLSNGFMDRVNPPMYVSTPMPNAGLASPPMRATQPNYSSPNPQSHLISPISGSAGNVAPMNEPQTLMFSFRHDGLYLHVTRLLRPVWKRRCVQREFESTINVEDCADILDDLIALKTFIDANSMHEFNSSHCIAATLASQVPSYSNGLSTLYQNNNISVAEQRLLSEEAQAEEKRSLVALNHFIKHLCEIFALWKILLENNFTALARSLPREQKSVLRNLTFRDVVLARFDVCSWFIITLINTYLNDNASVNSISAKLRQCCPNMYRQEDAVTYKASELLNQTKKLPMCEEREEKLQMALKLCKDAAPNLPLTSLCSQFTTTGFHRGVIELCSTMAQKVDPEEYGIHYLKSDEPTEDREGYAGYISRMNIYKEVRAMLDHVFDSTRNASAAERTDPDRVEFNSLEFLAQAIKMCIQTKDTVLHVCIYEWLLSHDMISELLSLSEPSLGEYLKRNVMRNPKDYRLIDLLWKYYEKNGHHIDAAKILDNLASLESDDINLEKRIEYLARAVMCMRNESLGYSVSNGVLLKELEDKLEIARVQKSILDAMKTLALHRPQLGQAIRELNCSLFDISHLYEQYAEHYHLWECKLRILNCSNHNDPLLIETVWSQIINNAVEGGNSTKEKCIRLFTKLDNLFKEFSDSGHCFPLAFLIKYLEIKACQLRFPPGIVPEKLIELNVDIELLLEYYLRMITMNERIWTAEGNEWHLIDSAIHAVGLLAKNLHLTWNRNKRRTLLKGQDVIASCLTLLYQKPGTERLQQQLKEVQVRLQRALA